MQVQEPEALCGQRWEEGGGGDCRDRGRENDDIHVQCTYLKLVYVGIFDPVIDFI